MSKKEKMDSQIHGLIVFKGKLAQRKTQELTKISEEIDQEDKIKLLYELAPFGANYRFSILILNESRAPITDIKIRFKYPQKIEILRYNPMNLNIEGPILENEMNNINIKIKKVNENTKNQITLFLDPKDSKIVGEISATTSYINANDLIRIHNSESIKFKLSPIMIEPKIIPSFQIVDFLKIEGIKKGIKSFGVGFEGKPYPELYFTQVNELLKKQNLQLITKDDDNLIAWYFGRDLESQMDILVIGQIISNKIEFLSASKNHHTIVSLLSSLENDFKNRIENLGLIKVEKIYNLECKFCGNVLPSFPNKGETITCQKCNKPQIVW